MAGRVRPEASIAKNSPNLEGSCREPMGIYPKKTRTACRPASTRHPLGEGHTMNDIRRVLRKASWRLGITETIRLFVLLVAAGLSAAILVRLAQLFIAFTLPWDVFAYWALGAAGVLAVVGAAVLRPKPDVVARRVDEGADLRETISTALWVEKSDEAWARATVADAAQRARGVDVRKAVPISAPAFWPVPMAMALALGILFVLRPMDLIGLKQARVAEEENTAQVIQAAMQTEEMRKKVDTMTDALGLDPIEPETFESGKIEPRDPDAIRKAMIKQISKKADEIAALKQSETGLKVGALKEAMRNLKTPGAELAPLTQAMAKGDFAKAQEELQKLTQQMNDGSLSPQQQKALAEQMQSLSQQLSQLAQQQDEIKKQLEQAGLDPNLASNPQALSQALEQAQNLSPQQKQMLQNLAQASQQCQGACQSMSQAMSQMAQACQNPGQGQQGQQGSGQQNQQGQQGAQQMSSQLSAAEMAAAEMQMAEASLSECKQMMASLGSQCQGGGQGSNPGSNNQGGGSKNGSDSTGAWAQGQPNSQGSGSGGPGTGNGGSPGEQAAKFNAIDRKAIGKVGEGPMIGTTLVQGEQVKGESKAAFSAAVEEAAQEASEEITSNVYPREYHEAIKAYFGNLQRKARGSGDGKKTDDPKPAEKKPDDAGNEQDAGAGSDENSEK